MLYSTTAYLMNYGQPQVNATSLFSRYRGNFMTGQDASAAIASLGQMSGYAPNSSGFNTLQGFGNQVSLANPTMTGAQAYKATGSLYTPSSFGALRRVGVTTIDRGGNRRSPLDIANQILKQVDPGQTVRTKDQIAQLMTDPFSGLNMTLGNWVASGIISGDQVDAVKGSIQSILQARQHGTSVAQLSSLMQQYGNGNSSAAKTLSSMGIAASDINKEKNLAASQRQGAVNTISDFDKGLDRSTRSLTEFTDALNALKEASGLNRITGVVAGLKSHGMIGGLLGLASMAGPVAGPISALGSGSEIGNMIGGGIHALSGLGGSLLGGGIGGSSESRMSVVSGHGSGHSSTRPSGGYAGGSGGGGAGGSTRGSSSGQKMSWPVNPHPLGTPFGQKGPMWQLGYHTGQDILVGTGTPVHAAATGTVIIAGWNSSYGNEIVISHGGGIYTRYAHNSRLVAHRGANVRQGQLISYSGATGNVTGPHLHFEVCRGGTGLRNAVNPLPYLTGAASVPGTTSGGNATPGGGGQSTGSGSSNDLGQGTSYTSSSASGSGTSYGAGMSELDVLSQGAGAGASGSSMSVTTGGTGSGPGGGSNVGSSTQGMFGWDGTYTTIKPGEKPPSGGGGGGSPSANKALGKRMAAGYGWTGSQFASLLSLWNSESGWRTEADNPTSSAYGIPQALISGRNMPRGYYDHKTGSGASTHAFGGDPGVQIGWGLNYIKGRYGDPNHAWSFWKSHHWYDKGAWEIGQDETARVHRGEMVVPAQAARQIREVLMNGNPYGAMGNRSGSGMAVEFKEGAIQITIQGSGSTAADGRAIANKFVDEFTSDQRIKNLMNGKVGV
jgi:hypothetical protein